MFFTLLKLNDKFKFIYSFWGRKVTLEKKKRLLGEKNFPLFMVIVEEVEEIR